MKLSYKWIKELTKINVSPKQYSVDMTMSGSKVESLYCLGDEITNVVTGKILSIEKHPDADKLFICQVDIGKNEPIQICTAATNLYDGAYIPVALAGATLMNGLQIKKSKLRGMESNGMLCSLDELGLTVHDFPDADEDGIMIIDECELGLDIHPILGLDDTCVEFEITPNRPDCFFVSGLARETAATYNLPFDMKTPVIKKSSDGDSVNNYVNISVEDTKGCTRYTAKVVKNVKIQTSPLWLRERLRTCGIRPINNLVDITNYVMLEYHPMHAFDLRNLDGDKIIVRKAKDGEKITTLDGIERDLDTQTLMICDANKPVAIAGIMGGEHSGVVDDTQTVVLESACFDGDMVRAASKKTGLRTESSTRFEKGLDSEICSTAVMRACELIEQLGVGEVVDGIIDIDNSNKNIVQIDFNPDKINKALGSNIETQKIERILKSLDMKIENGKIIPPSFRSDIINECDITEEIARIYGYDNIDAADLQGVAKSVLTPRQIFNRTITNSILAAGCNEVMTYSFISPKSYDKILMPKDDPCRNSVVIKNPLGEDTSVMRTTMLPSMLEVISHNYNNRNLQGNFYELGKEYIPAESDISEENLPLELQRLMIGMYGEDVDFYTVKGIIEQIFENLGIPETDYTFDSAQSPSFHPYRYAKINVKDKCVGFLGEIHPLVTENYGINTKCYTAKLYTEILLELQKTEREYIPLPKYPSVTRDITVICDERTEGAKLDGAISRAVGGILKKTTFLYSYQGEQIPEGKKSMSYSVKMRSKTGTLTDEEADKSIEKAVKALNVLGAERR